MNRKNAPFALPIATGGLLLAGALGCASWSCNGWTSGRLQVPVKNGLLALTQVRSPTAFALAIGLGILLAVLLAVLGWRLLRSARHEVAASARHEVAASQRIAVGAAATAPDLAQRIQVRGDGRSGQVLVKLFGHAPLDFYWECTGGEGVVLVQVPTVAEWRGHPVLSHWPRMDWLYALGVALQRLHPGTPRIVICDHWLELRQ